MATMNGLVILGNDMCFLGASATEMNSMILVERLIRAGFVDPATVNAGKDAILALEVSKPTTYAAVIIDFTMSDMGGEEFVDKARAVKGCRDLPIVFMVTDEPSDARVKLAQQKKKIAFLKRPFSEEELLHAIRTAFT